MYDLIVVGAGPAGTTTARVAAKGGLKTLLLERERLPRPKLCGGGITPKVLTQLDFRLPNELFQFSAKSVRLHVGERSHVFDSDRTLVHMIPRAAFDAYLAEKAVEAGAELKSPCGARAVNIGNSYAEAITSAGPIQSRLIVIADGASGSIEFKRRSRWKPHQVSYAIESEVPVDQETKQRFLEDAGYLDLYFGISPAGYGWIFPKDDHLTVGVGCRLSDLRDGPELFEHFMKQIPELAKTEIPKPQAHLVPLGGAGRIPTVSDRVLLAGDAGGFVEPLLGEGIYFAILSGQIAGATAVKACGKGRFDANYLRTYEKQCHAVFGIDLDVAYRVARFCYLDNYDMERATKFFFAEKKVRQCMVGLIDGSIRYRDAQTKLLWPYLKFSLMKLGLPIYN